jgi:beta-lactamase class D
MLLEKRPDYALRGKTGWTDQNEIQIGWFVGFVERNDETYAYALNLESLDSHFPMREARLEILKGVLKELGVFE